MNLDQLEEELNIIDEKKVLKKIKRQRWKDDWDLFTSFDHRTGKRDYCFVIALFVGIVVIPSIAIIQLIWSK